LRHLEHLILSEDLEDIPSRLKSTNCRSKLNYSYPR